MMKFAFSILVGIFFSSFLIASVNNHRPDWEKWDEENVAQIIDDFWQNSEIELKHRQDLAKLIQQFYLSNDCLLEVGCASGLFYEQLIPMVMSQYQYVGIDISHQMLAIARKRFPEALFLKDDVYALSFSNNAFEIVAAFEVFGHLGDIEGALKEMFRVASRLMIFTVWSSPQSTVREEKIGNSIFLHKTFSHEDIISILANTLDQEYKVTYIPLALNNSVAYIIHKIN